MSDYIEREAIKKRAIAIPLGGKFVEVVPVGEIESLPAADVAPVVHGRWFLDGDYEYINCSVCLCSFYMGFETSSEARKYLSRIEWMWKYCPNCGAKMYEVASDENYE